ncbi:methane monooxygenase PmoA-like [Algoriphagus aquaeductus]|uniref:Methane monooxygenase PmoA-like n=1 Tax=Algoriphagus aquaeductus TaxID=475299 RepID=A0A326RZL8_9BACT|nr:PmoA family protein [Algoriphagus aquaeductus]PZV87444.1 methane monooxygenase PmoA-like [Algoriphagus aquaeductus]
MAAVLLSLFSAINAQTSSTDQVRLIRKDAEQKVEIRVNGELFTAYYFPGDLAKPVLYPIKSVAGNDLTRGFPLDPRPGERIDHPHHVGHWFNYGDVNGLDFWNNSDAIPAEKKSGYGTIRHRGVKSMIEKGNRAELEVETDWLAPNGEILLKETTRFVFISEGKKRSIERMTTLSAQNQPVSLKDNKEGMFAIRVARELEHPSDKPELFTDANGIATLVPSLNNEGVTGKYLSSAGKIGDDVWGTRGTWVNLSGEIKGEKVAIAILDHPSNPGYPTYWHARGYGLFAANSLGQKALSGGKDELNFGLKAGESVTFRYKILIHSGTSFTDELLHMEFGAFSKK